ncbi:hypothetical protein CCR75_005562 [Bremia lactucae]|uniref:Uncharacterized protein n=1 Tax=Bremia lactucae TaxID=4779 RepID=A0A976FL33_BRELC|nr:hypothetical protein CCR75_005562 [Bremia lactucae]
MTDATHTGAPMAVATILSKAPLEPDCNTPADCDTCTEHSQELVVVEHRMELPELPRMPPLEPRRAPPSDRKREVSTSPEKDQLTGAIVPYQPTATVHKKAG